MKVWLEADRDTHTVVAHGEIDAGVKSTVEYDVRTDGLPGTEVSTEPRYDQLEAVELTIRDWKGNVLRRFDPPFSSTPDRESKVQMKSTPISCADLPENVTVSFTGSYNNGRDTATSISPLISAYEMCGFDREAQQALRASNSASKNLEF